MQVANFKTAYEINWRWFQKQVSSSFYFFFKKQLLLSASDFQILPVINHFLSIIYASKLRKYRKNSKIWDTSNNCHNCPKNWKVWCNIALMHPKDADGMANSTDPDQTASSEAVWSWSALFAETYLFQYIEFVRYQGFVWKAHTFANAHTWQILRTLWNSVVLSKTVFPWL